MWEKYLEMGFSIIPIRPGTKAPAIPSWREFTTRRPTRDECLQWQERYPGCGWAIITGRISGVVGFDSDDVNANPPLPPTLTCRTGKGRHYYYRIPEGAFVKTRKVEGIPGVDTLRGEGSYLVAPPSLHPSGSRYEWEGELKLGNIAYLPSEFLSTWGWAVAQAGAPEGVRNDSLASYIGRLIRGVPSDMWEDLWPTVVAVAARCNPPITPDDPEEWKKLRSTFDSIRRAEMRRRLEEAGEVDVTFLSDVQPEPVQWLWFPYLPVGKLVIMEGHPGEGKTWVALAIAADVTRGKPIVPVFLGSAPTVAHGPRNVLYMTAEDGLQDTIRPRFDRLGGDPSRIVFLGEKRKGARKGLISLAEDLDLLARQIEVHSPALVVIDPLDAYLGERVDFFRANEVRPILTQVSNLADRYRTCVVIIRHYAKTSRDRVILRGQGSVAISAAARSLLQVGAIRDVPGRFALVHVKSNLAPKGPAIEFELLGDTFRWIGPNESITPAIVHAPDPIPTYGEGVDTDDAAEFLVSYLKGGPRPVKEVYAAGKEKLRLSAKAIDRARRRLGIRSKLVGDEWFWVLEGH